MYNIIMLLKYLISALILWSVLFPSIAVAQPVIDQSARKKVSVAAAVPVRPDYARKSAWSRLPDNPAKPVDVFYVYPTIFGGEKARLMDVSREDLRRKADVQVDINAGVFEETANVFAPYYRQASIEILYMPEEDVSKLLAVAYKDVETAFDYYIRRLNQGRPFILAGFSQGSMALLQLLKDRFEDPDLQEKLVAAYIIGYTLTKQDLAAYPWLKAARGAEDTGVIISYNTQLPGYGYSYVLREGGVSINPVNWRTDRRIAQKKEHKGAVIFDIMTGKKLREIPHFSACYIEKGTRALVVNADPKVYSASQPVFAPGVMHMYDYMFFYKNLKENVQVRTDAYLHSAC